MSWGSQPFERFDQFAATLVRATIPQNLDRICLRLPPSSRAEVPSAFSGPLLGCQNSSTTYHEHPTSIAQKAAVGSSLYCHKVGTNPPPVYRVPNYEIHCPAAARESS